MKETSTFPASETDINRPRTMKDSDIAVDDEAPAWTPGMFAWAVARNGSEQPLRARVTPLPSRARDRGGLGNPVHTDALSAARAHR